MCALFKSWVVDCGESCNTWFVLCDIYNNNYYLLLLHWLEILIKYYLTISIFMNNNSNTFLSPYQKND